MYLNEHFYNERLIQTIRFVIYGIFPLKKVQKKKNHFLTRQVHGGREHGRPSRMVVLVVAVVVSTGGRCRRRGCRGGRCSAVMTVAGDGGRGGSGCGQVVAHSRVVRPGGHRRGGTEPVRGVRHLAAGGQVAVAHGRVVHVGSDPGAGQTVEVGLVQVRVVHDDRYAVYAFVGPWPRYSDPNGPSVISSVSARGPESESYAGVNRRWPGTTGIRH